MQSRRCSYSENIPDFDGYFNSGKLPRSPLKQDFTNLMRGFFFFPPISTSAFVAIVSSYSGLTIRSIPLNLKSPLACGEHVCVSSSLFCILHHGGNNIMLAKVQFSGSRRKKEVAGRTRRCGDEPIAVSSALAAACPRFCCAIIGLFPVSIQPVIIRCWIAFPALVCLSV